jgi:hypothetical protein
MRVSQAIRLAQGGGSDTFPPSGIFVVGECGLSEKTAEASATFTHSHRSPEAERCGSPGGRLYGRSSATACWLSLHEFKYDVVGEILDTLLALADW